MKGGNIVNKYFRTLFLLIRFFLEDDYLFIYYPKDRQYYPIIRVVRKMLMEHILKPFKSTHTIKLKAKYALAFQERILFWDDTLSPEKVMPEFLDKWLFDYGLSLRNISYNNGVILNFSYSYIEEKQTE